jgi:hypothetical protein
MCPDCGTVCASPNENKYPILWIDSVNDLRFINPDFWALLGGVIGGNSDPLLWLCDSRYAAKNKVPTHIDSVFTSVFDRKHSYRTLCNELENIILFLLNDKTFIKKPKKVEALKRVLHIYRTTDNIFSKSLPLPNKALFVMERATKGSWGNLDVSAVIDVARRWLKVVKNNNDNYIQRNMAIVIHELDAIFVKFTTTYLLGKPGMFRKNIAGSRHNFGARAVITSIQVRHKYDEMHIPWVLGVDLFKPHLMNLLINRYKFSLYDTEQIISRGRVVWSSLLAECFRTLIKESKNLRIPHIALRNPSLFKESYQLYYISRVKGMYLYDEKSGGVNRTLIDFQDRTIGLPMQGTVAFNADFDGDNMAITPILDNFTEKLLANLQIHTNTMSRTVPFGVSDSVSLLGAAQSIIDDFMIEDRGHIDDDPVIAEVKRRRNGYS